MRRVPAASIATALTTAFLLAGCTPTSTTAAGGPSPKASAGPGSGRAGVQLQSWLFPGSPGEPQCAGQAEYRDDRLRSGALKPEYWKVQPDGEVLLETTAQGLCNAYSTADVGDLKAHSAQQYPTLSGMTTLEVHALVSSATRRTQAVRQLTDLVRTEELTGVDVDLEDFWSWSSTGFTDYLTFLSQLADSLHKAGKRLQVDAPPMTQDESWYDYVRVVRAGADELVIMAYDEEFDSLPGGTPVPVARYKWLQQIVRYAQAKVPDPNRLVIALPSYGYSAPAAFDRDKVTGSIPFSVMRTQPGWSGDPAAVERRRDPDSGEIRWTSDGMLYDYVDSIALNRKLDTITALGVTKVSVWALGGNPWFGH